MSEILTDGPDLATGQPDANTNKPWYDGADADTIGYIQNKKWDAETPLKVVESYRNLEKYHGVPADQLIKIPKADDATAWDAVYAKLGRPESPDKYGFDTLSVPEGIEIDKNLIGKFDAIFHKTGATPAQRNAIINAYMQEEAAFAQEHNAKLEQEKAIQVNALKKEWGDKFDERVVLAKRAFKAFLPEGVDKEQVAEALEASLGTAVVAKLFANLAERLGEDKFHDDGGNDTAGFGYSREQAINDKNSLVKEIGADPGRLAAYNKGSGADYEKMMRLLKIINA